MLNAEIKALVAGMAQEIWNPLTVIKTMMYAMGAELPADDPRHTDFGVVNKEIVRMEGSIQQFLDFTWPPDPILAPVRLSQVLGRAIERFARKAEAQGVQIESSVDVDVAILADQRQIELVFVNLGLNALRVMPTGGTLSIVATAEQVFVNLALAALPATTAAARPEPGANGANGGAPATGSTGVGVTVADTGEGIPHEVLPRVFEPFAIPGGNGVGLSLAIVQQIVARHGGQIEAHNRPEGGATFTVILPRVHAGPAAP